MKLLNVLRILIACLVAVIMMCSSRVTAQSPVCFDIPADNQLTAGTVFAVTGDFNNDGKIDLASSGTSLLINLGNGNGTFAPAVEYPANLGVQSIVVADFNGDSKSDVAIVNQVSSDVSVLLGDGAGGFGAAVNYAVSTFPLAIVCGDFNGDGFKDLAVAHNSAGKVAVLINNGNGTFAAAVNYTTTSPAQRSITLGDYDGDSKIDLITAGSGGLYMMKGSGNGTFAAPVQFANTNNIRSAASGDIDGDGDADVVFSTAANNVQTWLNNGTGTLTLGVIRPTSVTNTFLTLIDIDADGDKDVLATSQSGANGGTMVLRNDGSTISVPELYSLGGTSPTSLAVADFNGDNNLDVVQTASSGTKIMFGTGSPSSQFIFPAGKQNLALTQNGVVMDMNHDQKADLAVAVSGTVQYYEGSGGGSFIFKGSQATGPSVSRMVDGDFNGDGHTDLAVVNNQANNVSILLGNGASVFASAVNYTVGDAPYSVTRGDFNGDGKVDLAVGSLALNSITILLGAGDGTFNATGTSPATGNFPLDLVSADFNGDGKADIASANQNGSTVSVLLGDGAGGFAPGILSEMLSGIINTLRVGDFNEDGKADIVANSVVLSGNGDGTFTVVTSLPGGTSIVGVTIADFNKDGHADIAIANSFPNPHAIFLGKGDGTFLPAFELTDGSLGATVIGAGDVNNDGRPDVLVTHSTSSDLTVFINRSAGNIAVTGNPNFCPGGSVMLSAPYSSLSYVWSPGGETTRDIVVTTAGVYSVTTGNTMGTCSSTSNQVTVSTSSFTTPVATLTQPTCMVSTGTAAITVQHATDTYSFDGGSNFQTSNSKSGLTAGNYSLVIKDVNGCVSTNTTITILSQPSTPTTPSATPTQPTCSTATGDIAVTQQNIDDTYSFDNGVTFQSTNSKSGLATGSYQIVLRNAAGCASGSITIVINTQPRTPTTPVSTITQPTCTLATATITIAIQNSTDTYSFDGGTNFQSSNTKTGLIAGNYSIKIKSVGDCQSTATSVTVLSQPSTPLNPVRTVTQPTCSVATGSIAVTQQNAGDTFSFDNGVTFQTGNTKSGLAAGSYQIVIKNAAGCQSAAIATAINAQPVSPSKPTIALSGSNTHGPILTTTTASAYQWYKDGAAISGATSVSYSVTGPGLYTVVVSSANGCTSIPSDPQVIVITGLEEPTNSYIRLYPNPAVDWLTVSLGEIGGLKSIMILDMNGRITDTHETNDSEARFEVAGYAIGAYVVKVKTERADKIIQFIKR
jgi:hypothetical protein